jgi:acyl carrier protein
MEKELLSIWQRVLNLDQIGVQDDLLAMGGDSIKAASILMYVDEYFKVTLSLGEIFMAPTIAAMAQMISERRSKGENRE